MKWQTELEFDYGVKTGHQCKIFFDLFEFNLHKNELTQMSLVHEFINLRPDLLFFFKKMEVI